MDLRRTLFSTIVLCGGSTLIKGWCDKSICVTDIDSFTLTNRLSLTVLFVSGFGERLLTEVKKLAPKDVKIKVGLDCGGVYVWPGWQFLPAVRSISHGSQLVVNALSNIGVLCVCVTCDCFLSRSLLLRRGFIPHGLGKYIFLSAIFLILCFATFDKKKLRGIPLSSPPLLFSTVVALSWRHWIPLKRCGCLRGNMRKTEHVPSTGRPSNRGRCPAIAPRTALKSPLSCCWRLPYYLATCTNHLRVPINYPL